MDELAKLFTSPAWWVSTVVVAFLVNIAASYAKPFFEQLIASWSKKRRIKLKEQRERDDAIVMYLIENPQRLIDVRTDATYTVLRIIVALSLAVFITSLIRFLERYVIAYFMLMNLADIFLIVVYLLSIIIALRQFNRYRVLRRIVDKCSDSIYTYDRMPIDVVNKLSEEENN